MFEYFPAGTCAKKIMFSIEDNKLRNLHFYRGCDGNLKTLSRLLEGLDVDDVVEKLKGIQCGTRGTSCSDQLALAIIEAKRSRQEHPGKSSAATNLDTDEHLAGQQEGKEAGDDQREA